ncbi:MAG: glycosyltransferase family 2 protein [Acidobacteria bacterium]|nr:glycosyltransferase family 2 protein [Acidobacteriota bacterium]
MNAQQPRAASTLTVDVVIPVLNEAHVLAKSVATVRKFLQENLPHRWRVVIVDNGSTDGTDKVAQELTREFNDVAFVRLDQRGRGRALHVAWMQSPAAIVSYMDVDLSTELAALPRAVKALSEEGYDIAIGSRLMRESRTKRSFKREFISRMYNVFVKLVLFTKFSDAQCGFKVLTRQVVEHIVPQIKDQSWFFDTEMLVLAERQGYRIKDLPVKWDEDDDSRVKIISTAWEDIKGVLRLRRLLWSRAFAEAAEIHRKRAQL